jgi:nicotinate-nucleotide--dimethylbenzimidazole phosphoribosyltransferase
MKTLLEETLQAIKSPDTALGEQAQRRLDSLTKPQGSLGRLEEMARRLVEITGNTMPSCDKKVIFTFACDHEVAREGVSAYPKEVTRQMVFNFLQGGAGINVLAKHAGADVVVVDIGVDYDFGDAGGLIKKKVSSGMENMLKGPAMSREKAVRSIEIGVELVRKYSASGYKIFGTGEMGIGNTTPSSAIASVLMDLGVSETTGRGTGITDEALKQKVSVIERAIELNRPDSADPVDVLSKVGGAEIGGIAGVCLGGAAEGVPVVVDGFISTAGALIACALEPRVKDYLFAAHCSVEKGHRAMLEWLGLRPILDLEMRLGEGTGAALAMLVIEGGLKIYREMATFGEAGVSEKE